MKEEWEEDFDDVVGGDWSMGFDWTGGMLIGGDEKLIASCLYECGRWKKAFIPWSVDQKVKGVGPYFVLSLY